MSNHQHMLQGTMTLQLKDAKFRIIFDEPQCQFYNASRSRHSGGDQQRNPNATTFSEPGSDHPSVNLPNSSTPKTHLSTLSPGLNLPNSATFQSPISSSGGNFYSGILHQANQNSLPSPILSSPGNYQQQQQSGLHQPNLRSPPSHNSSCRQTLYPHQNQSKFEPNFNSTLLTSRPEPVSPFTPSPPLTVLSGGQPTNYSQARPFSEPSSASANRANDTSIPTQQNIGVPNSGYGNSGTFETSCSETPPPSRLQTQTAAPSPGGTSGLDSGLNPNHSSLHTNRQRQNASGNYNEYTGRAPTMPPLEGTSYLSGAGTSDSSSTYMEIIAKGKTKTACVNKIEEILVNLASELEDVGVSFNSIVNGLKSRGVSLDGIQIPDQSSSTRTYTGRSSSHNGNSADQSLRFQPSIHSPSETSSSRSTRNTDRQGQENQRM